MATFDDCSQVVSKPGGEAKPEDTPTASAAGTTVATPAPAPFGKRAGTTTALPGAVPCTCNVAKSGEQDDDGSSSVGVDTLTVVVIVIAILQQLGISVAAVMYCQNRKSGAADEVKKRARAQRGQHAQANSAYDTGGTYDTVATHPTFAPQGGLEVTNYADGSNSAA